jgi:hypothetical protein
LLDSFPQINSVNDRFADRRAAAGATEGLVAFFLAAPAAC